MSFGFNSRRPHQNKKGRSPLRRRPSQGGVNKEDRSPLSYRLTPVSDGARPNYLIIVIPLMARTPKTMAAMITADKITTNVHARIVIRHPLVRRLA
jgi:hypothetical protein